MAMLYIKCPRTDKLVPTGFDGPKNMDLSGFQRISISCPHCKGVHVWSGKDAFFLNYTLPKPI